MRGCVKVGQGPSCSLAGNEFCSDSKVSSGSCRCSSGDFLPGREKSTWCMILGGLKHSMGLRTGVKWIGTGDK